MNMHDNQKLGSRTDAVLCIELFYSADIAGRNLFTKVLHLH